MAKRFAFALFLVMSLTFLVPEKAPVVGHVFSVKTSEAQSQRRSLFDIIFDRRNKRRNRLREKVRRDSGVTRPKRNVIRRQEPRRSTASAPPPPEPEAVPKSENAAKILVTGDFVAAGIARQLVKLYQENPNVEVVSSTSPASGIVRYDVVNWEETIPPLIEEHKPVVMVNLLGMNDRQAMRLPDGRVQELTEPWLKAYEGRVTRIAGFAASNNIPLIWVGLPPVRFSKMNKDYLAFNDIYRTKVEAIGGVFADVWDGFTNEEGKFVSAGPDINGQIVRLRDSKGINMTRAGYRKLAFYVDKELRKFGITADPEDLQISATGNFRPSLNQPSVPEYDPARSGTTVVMSLGAATPDKIEPLEGEKDFLKSEENTKSVSFDLVEKGVGYEPKSGRIDATWGIPVDRSAGPGMSDSQKRHALETKPAQTSAATR